VEGPPSAVAELLRALPDGAGSDVLGPVPAGEGLERVLLRTPRRNGADLAGALKAAAGVRSARKAEPLRIELDPRTLA
jgi:primosomal protein N' (replication factor Y)